MAIVRPNGYSAKVEYDIYLQKRSEVLAAGITAGGVFLVDEMRVSRLSIYSRSSSMKIT